MLTLTTTIPFNTARLLGLTVTNLQGVKQTLGVKVEKVDGFWVEKVDEKVEKVEKMEKKVEKNTAKNRQMCINQPVKRRGMKTDKQNFL